jgi:hypothetical protein
MRCVTSRTLVLVALALLVALAGCGGSQSDVTPVGTPTATDATNDTPTDSPTATPSPTSTPTPADSDGDGLVDSRERKLGTDPTAADTDGDGLNDRVEVEGATDPTVADTDGDGLDDGTEVNGLTNATLADTDDDGLDDGTERAAATNATLADTDDDGLNDGREQKLGTNATLADTDGDGLDDGAEVRDAGPLDGADPLHMDIFVEIDYMEGEKPDRAALDLVVQQYANAPIDNPDGESGITLHVVVDDEIPQSEPTNTTALLEIGKDHFDNFAKGYYYGVFVTDARLKGNDTTGFASQTAMAMQSFPETAEEAHIFTHELGHAAGLAADVYEGIDSRKVPYSEYPSAMNYNSDFDVYHYATGENTTFDDWAYLEANFVEPPTARLNESAG